MLKTSWGLGLVALGLVFAVLALPEEYKWLIPYGIAGIVICCLGILFAEVRERKEKTDSGINAIKSVADRYIENRNNTTDQESLDHLVRSGATDLKSEKELEIVCEQIKKRTGFDPFYKWGTIPKGRRLEAIKRLKDRGINIDDPEQCLDFLWDFTEGTEGGRRKADKSPN